MARVLLLGPPPREWPLSSSCPAFSLSPALAAAASGSGRSSGRIHPPADPPAVPRAQGLRAAGRRRRSIGSSEENRRTRAPRATGAQAVGKGGRRRKEEEEEEEGGGGGHPPKVWVGIPRSKIIFRFFLILIQDRRLFVDIFLCPRWAPLAGAMPQ